MPHTLRPWDQEVELLYLAAALFRTPMYPWLQSREGTIGVASASPQKSRGQENSIAVRYLNGHIGVLGSFDGSSRRWQAAVGYLVFCLASLLPLLSELDFSEASASAVVKSGVPSQARLQIPTLGFRW